MQLYATFGLEVAKLRASPPRALALPADVVYHEAEKLELPALPRAVKVESETVKVEVREEEDEVKGEVLLVKTVSVVQEDTEAGSEGVQVEETMLVKLEASS